MTLSSKSPGILFALAAAILFGASTPVAKTLIKQVPPALMASLLYLGSACGLGLWLAVRKRLGFESAEASLNSSDLPWLGGAIISGGVIGPLFLMVGLKSLSGFAASLLLNMEAIFTITLAWFVFHEHFDRRIALGAVAIVLGSIVLSWGGNSGGASMFGVTMVVGACLAWGIDNNVTRRISGGDPVQIAFLKGLAGGTVNLFIWVGTTPSGLSFKEWVTEGPAGWAVLIPNAEHGIPAFTLAYTGLVGLAGYGISLVFFILALRNIGTARTGAYFSTAPFIGSLLSIILLGDRLTVPLAVSSILMAIGVWLHITENHSHEHLHDELEHDHIHSHDDLHHDHEHAGIVGSEPHSHRHMHFQVMHSHPHYPDIHHQHSH